MCHFPTTIVHFVCSKKITHKNNAQLNQNLSFLRVLFFYVNCLEVLVLTHNILRMTVSKKNEAKVL